MVKHEFKIYLEKMNKLKTLSNILDNVGFVQNFNYDVCFKYVYKNVDVYFLFKDIYIITFIININLNKSVEKIDFDINNFENFYEYKETKMFRYENTLFIYEDFDDKLEIIRNIIEKIFINEIRLNKLNCLKNV